MFRLTRREQVLLVGFLVLILAVSGIYMYERPSMATQIPLPNKEETTKQSTANIDVPPAKASGEVKVDVKGAVHSPGVYSLPGGSRVADAIQAAGGASEQSDLEALNLAQKLQDGGYVLVPEKGNQQKANSSGSANTPAGSLAQNGKLNINTATEEQLDALQGIGLTRAKAIVQHREQYGPFQTVEDLLKIKGFGPKLLETIKDRLTAY